MKYFSGLIFIALALAVACDDGSVGITKSQPPQDKRLASYDYQEVITRDSTYRSVRARDDSSSGLVYEFTGAGNPDFEQSLEVLDFEHTLLGIEPSPLPDGLIRRGTLDLKFIERSGRFVQAVIDSLEFEKAQRMLVLVDTADSSFADISGTLLADGILKVDVTGVDGRKFKLKQSNFRVDYTITAEEP